MKIKTVKIPNRFGVNCKVAITELTEKQLFIQQSNTDSQLEILSNRFKNLKDENIALGKERRNKAKNEISIMNNVKTMMTLEMTLSFLRALKSALETEYNNRHSTLDKFSNEVYEEMFLQVAGESGEVE